jgi:hypothetical protein
MLTGTYHLLDEFFKVIVMGDGYSVLRAFLERAK